MTEQTRKAKKGHKYTVRYILHKYSPEQVESFRSSNRQLYEQFIQGDFSAITFFPQVTTANPVSRGDYINLPLKTDSSKTKLVPFGGEVESIRHYTGHPPVSSLFITEYQPLDFEERKKIIEKHRGSLDSRHKSDLEFTSLIHRVLQGRRRK